MHRKLVEAVRARLDIAEIVISDGLEDRKAFRLEYGIICAFHKSCSGQLWNTIDERLWTGGLYRRIGAIQKIRFTKWFGQRAFDTQRH